MFCHEIMKPAITCGETEPVEKAAVLMRDREIGFVPIVDAHNHAVGVVTDRDLTLRVLAEGRPASTPCAAVMTREPIVCRPDDWLHDAEKVLMNARKCRIVVVDSAGLIVGVISLSDIAQAEGRLRVGKVFKEVVQREASAVVEEPVIGMPP